MKIVKAVVLIFVSLMMLISPTANATNEKKMQAKMEKYLGFVMGTNKDEGKVLVIPTCKKKPILIKSTTKNFFKEDVWMLESDIWVQKDEKKSDPGYKICYLSGAVVGCVSLIKIPSMLELRYKYGKNQVLEPKLVLINTFSIWRVK